MRLKETIKRNNIHIMGIPEGKEWWNSTESLFKQTRDEKF